MSRREYRNLAEQVHAVGGLYRLLKHLGKTGGAREEALVSRFSVSRANTRAKLDISSRWKLVSKENGVWKLEPKGHAILTAYEKYYPRKPSRTPTA